MKKIISIFIIMILLCSSFSSVYADEEATETLPNRNTVSAELVG